MKLTEEQYNTVQNNLEEIEKIIRSKSMFNCSIALKEQVLPLCNISCKSCSSAIWQGLNLLYSKFIQDRYERKKNQETQGIDKPQPSVKKNRRKPKNSI